MPHRTGWLPVVVLSPCDYRDWIDADRSADLDELRHIDAPLQQFNLGDERLPLTNAPAELCLGEAGFFPRLDKSLNDVPVEIGSEATSKQGYERRLR